MVAPTVTEILLDITARTAGTVIVPMALPNPERHTQIIGGLREAGTDVRHVTLLATERIVHRRLRRRFERRGSWASAQFAHNNELLRGPMFASHIDTDMLSLAQVVQRVGAVIGQELNYSTRDKLLLPARRLAVTLRHLR